MRLKKFLLPKYKTELERVGGANDGGYPMSIKILKKTNYLFSIGLGDDWTFEQNASRINNNLKIFMFDAQVNLKNWIKKLIKELFYFFSLKLSIKKVISTILLYLKYIFFFDNKKNYHIKKNIVNSKEIIINEEYEKNLKIFLN